ncbi:ATPase [Rhodophyticola sp. CCM32]|uniref:ATP12 family chaperone protein n=1 Tax=Rhodophyticola sp. CCM32 TaxID=2916397 RepID=UPI00107F8D37|nr:ATP12 family protein [Rhodophyticola sp. CCM32]QBY02380.1 ATPase [Rhodophyticola sp. CCM32]
MSEWAAKRFWDKAEVSEAGAGFQVTLDARPLRTPFKSALILPTRAMARAVAGEWGAQGEQVDPLSMPVTRSANSAIDKVAPQHAAVAAMLAGYAETDLLCHRAGTPEGLVQRQTKGWDPVLDWAARIYHAPLIPTEGVLPVGQPEDSLTIYGNAVSELRPFSLTGFHDLVTLSGSLILALAVHKGQITVQEAWSLSRIDESWQIEQWGKDDEATEFAARKKDEFFHAARFLKLSDGA